ncbi:MAG: Nif3-like dinuclear metal center hexameric protein [Proteobacteria bacterium]|nr:Nif3-like dinuclear metal center hexameric protein [Pseudomonadota bacterium]MBU1058948.1 Nif3-like dinuclear metal center hexameric protein [Pseudomonadota bacterium]
MILQVSDLLEGINRFAPFGLAESWDNVGLLIGRPDRQVRSLLLGLDPTLSLLEEAVNRGADTLITHHPCIFRPLSAVNTATPVGAFLERALEQKINVIACHTNLDSAVEGVSDALAERLGLTGLSLLHAVNFSGMSGVGLGRIGTFPVSLSFPDFLQRVFDVLGIDGVHVAGTPPDEVKTVALCGGSGSEFAEDAQRCGADVYLSAEIKHSTARWAEESGLCIIDGTHYGTEQPALALLADKLGALAREKDWDVNIIQTDSERPAFTLIHK